MHATGTLPSLWNRSDAGEWSYTTPGLYPTTLTAEGSSVHNPNARPSRLLDLDNELTRTVRRHPQASHTTRAPVGLHDL
ncbi:hypothetical protein NSND_60897 [Nitrospira sp. ND1]|nr:hypothetical protein NSND_60897 [Nitrospira sp. ND1]